MIAGQVISSTDTSVGGDTPAASPGTPATTSFDLVLALESLGAAPMTELTGQLNLEIGADGFNAEDDGTDDSDSADDAEPLAFLAGLLGTTILNAATPAGTPPAGTANVAAADPLLAVESGLPREGAVPKMPPRASLSPPKIPPPAACACASASSAGTAAAFARP